MMRVVNTNSSNRAKRGRSSFSPNRNDADVFYSPLHGLASPELASRRNPLGEISRSNWDNSISFTVDPKILWKDSPILNPLADMPELEADEVDTFKLIN